MQTAEPLPPAAVKTESTSPLFPSPPLQLTLAKVDYTGTDIGPMPALRIAQLYADRIANPHDVIQWVSRRLTRAQRAEVDVLW